MNSFLKMAYDYGCQAALEDFQKEAGLAEDAASLFEDETDYKERILASLGGSGVGASLANKLQGMAGRAVVDDFNNARLDEHVMIDPTYIKDFDPSDGHFNFGAETSMKSLGLGPDYEVLPTKGQGNNGVEDMAKVMGLNSPTIAVTDSMLKDHFAPEVAEIRGPRSNPEGRITVSNNPLALTKQQRELGGKAVNRAILLHEMGHATAAAPNASLGRKLLAKSTVPGKNLSVLAPLIAPLVIDPNDERQLAGAIGFNALTHLPVLGEEFLASRKAYKGLDDLVDAAKITDAARLAGKQSLRKAYKTYLGGAAGGIIGPSIAMALMNDDIRDAVNPFN